MGGGRTVTTTGNISPELSPLFSSSAGRLTRFQTQSPLTPYTGRYPKQTYGLSGSERLAGGLVPGLGQTPVTEGLALRDILRLPSLAGRTPTTGANTQQPSVFDAL